ncbi:hypothetical protein LG198_05235 [Methylobacillus arboreus]|uniref:DUF6152 family protein n=1 Tax=Methylobacillus arboreus TaxID=755170 RepID=UPI001E59BB4A|nr:DUF6152 family protein [Methylobacillus arboreus]MCB5190125.1 hypothetical protein [Methylobacillus arboreus]
MPTANHPFTSHLAVRCQWVPVIHRIKFLFEELSVQLLNTRFLGPIVLAVTSVIFASTPANAHHAFSAEFDSNQPIQVKGKVTKLELVNPHSWLYLDVQDASGNVTNWGFEFGTPFGLRQKGLAKSTLPIGTEVTIKGYRAKSGKAFGYAVVTVLADGRSFETGGAQDAPTAREVAQ